MLGKFVNAELNLIYISWTQVYYNIDVSKLKCFLICRKKYKKSITLVYPRVLTCCSNPHWLAFAEIISKQRGRLKADFI